MQNNYSWCFAVIDKTPVTRKNMNKVIGLLTLALCLLAPCAAWGQGDTVMNVMKPAAVTSDFVYGVFGGVGGLFPASSISNDFKGHFLFQIGATGGYGNWRLKTEVQFGQPSFKNSNIFNKHDAQGHPIQGNSHAYAGYLGWGVQLGYVVYRGHRLSITPNAGCYLSKYSWTIDNLEWSKNDKGEDQFQIMGNERAHVQHLSWIMSLDFDYRLHTTVTDRPFLGNGYKRFTSSVRLSPFLSYGKYDKTDPAIKGFLMGVTVNYMGLLQSLGL